MPNRKQPVSRPPKTQPRQRSHVHLLWNPLCMGAVLVLAAAIGLGQPKPSHAGTVTGAATEWTQLLNNAELAQIVGLEGQILSKEAQSLVAQLEQLQTQIKSYLIMLRNIQSLPQQHLKGALSSIMKLRNIATAAGSIASSGKSLDEFLRSGLFTDPLFERRGLDRARTAESYTEWNNRWHATMKTGLHGAGMTLEDAESEGRLIDRITAKFGTETGQMQVLQGANQIAASMARQMNDLRALTATQAETNTIAFGRILADMDRKEASRRLHEREVHETLEQLQGARGRTLNDIFGIGR